MRKELAVSALLALTIVGMAFSGAAQLETDGSPGTLNSANTTDGDEYENESSNITVEVNSKTQIDVKPEELNFPSMDVGTQENVSDNGDNQFGALELENIGSEYIDKVWVNSTAPTDSPFGSGQPSEYDAGNFLMLKPSNESSKTSIRGNSSTYHFVNRYEFMNSDSSESGDIPSYIEAETGDVNGFTNNPQDSYVGRFRAGDEWYFYTVYTGTTGSDDVCDGSGSAVLRVGNTSHSPDSFGTVDFESSGSDYTDYTIGPTSGSYGKAEGGPADETGVRLEWTRSGGSTYYREYDVLTSCDTSAPVPDQHTIRTRYNVQAGDTEDLTAGGEIGSRTQFLLDSGTSSPQSTMLLPGEGLTVDTAVQVPQGVPEGGVSDGKVTFFVTSDVDAGPGTVP